MDEIAVSTVVYEEPETVYEFLVDFPRYGRYSEHLTEVRTLEGDGGPGTRYALRFAWWKLTYTAHSEVTDVEPPTRIDWRVTRDIDAHGCWRIEPTEAPPIVESPNGNSGGNAGDAGNAHDEDAGDAGSADDKDAADVGNPVDEESESPVEACRVTFEVRFDPHSAKAGALDIPRFVSMDWVLGKVIPLIKSEAERIVERAVADLEGRQRSIELEVYSENDRS